MKKPFLTALLCATALFFSTGSAASLLHLLPAETLAAFGVEGLAEHEDKANVFIDEWNRLDLTNLLEAAYGDAGDTAGEGSDAEVPQVLLDADPLDLIGQELWLVVSASSFNPLPAVTLVGTMNDAGRAVVQALFDEASAGSEVTTLTEGTATFHVIQPKVEAGDSDFGEDLGLVVAYGQVDDLVVVSSNPDVTRGVLRRYQGTSEPNLTQNAAFTGTVGALGGGNLYTFLDLPAMVEVARPFAAGAGFDALVERLGNAFSTAGSFGSVTTIVDDGFEGVSLRVLGERANDPLLYDLLAGSAGVSDATQAFVAPTALGYSVATVDLPGWWAWLGDVAASEPQLGVTDLNQMVEQMAGLDVEQTLFDWMGEELATITAGFAPATDIGAPMQNPLGDSLYLIEATDEQAAREGLATLFQVAASTASAFMDPMGEGEPIAPTTSTVAGVEVTQWDLADGFSLSTAVVDGYAIIATTPEAIVGALEARSASAGLSGTLAPLRSRVPAGVRSYSLSDDRASLVATADTLLGQMGMFTGMTGGDIDFEAAEAANTALAEFVRFVSERFAGSVGYSWVDGATVKGETFTTVQW